MNDDKAKAGPGVYMGSLSMEWPMPSIQGGDSPCQLPPKGAKKGTFSYGIDAKAKTVSTFPLGFPKNGMINANYYTPSPSQKSPNAEKRSCIYGNDAKSKNR